MTIDDDNSIYVGGIPYDCTEDDLRLAFELYGSIVAIKIINDRGIGGKCYAFLTFTNPRSTVDAINDMDGRIIGGRVVKVNEVKTRGAGRSNYGRDYEGFQRSERRMGWGRVRGRDRDRDDYDERDHYRDRSSDRDRDRDREGGYNHVHINDRTRDPFHDREDAEAIGNQGSDPGRSRDCNYVEERDRRDRHHTRDTRGRKLAEDKDQHSKKRSRSSSYDQHSREPSSESSDYHHKLEEQLELLSQRREKLTKEKSEMDLRIEEKKQFICDLQRRSLKLEDALTSAKKVSLLRQAHLNKLRKCFLHVKECGDRLKNSERELQGLVESVMLDVDVDADGLRDGHLINGKTR